LDIYDICVYIYDIYGKKTESGVMVMYIYVRVSLSLGARRCTVFRTLFVLVSLFSVEQASVAGRCSGVEYIYIYVVVVVRVIVNKVRALVCVCVGI